MTIEQAIKKIKRLTEGTPKQNVYVYFALTLAEEREMFRLALEALQEKQERANIKNEPLTWEELILMDGEPVYAVSPKLSAWVLVEVDFEADIDIYLTDCYGRRAGYCSAEGLKADGITLY